MRRRKGTRLRSVATITLYASLTALFLRKLSGSPKPILAFIADDHIVIEGSPPDCSSTNTIVTAFYDLGENSKHTSKEYDAWLKTFLSLSDAMVIFTAQELVHRIERARKYSLRTQCTVIVPQSLDEVFTARAYNWRAQALQDPEADIHKSTSLYIVWNQKSYWLAQVALANPFNSTMFFWADAGQFRSGLPWSDSREFIQAINIPRGRVVHLMVQPFTVDDLKARDDSGAKIFSSLEVRLGGGNFGGDESAVLEWKRVFYEQLERYIAQQMFAGKDQPIASTACLQKPGLCHLIHPKNYGGNVWFSLQSFLHTSLPEPFETRTLRSNSMA